MTYWLINRYEHSVMFPSEILIQLQFLRFENSHITGQFLFLLIVQPYAISRCFGGVKEIPVFFGIP